MTKIMTFNGVDMSKFFRVRNIIRPIGNKRSVSTDSAPLIGVNVQEVKIGEKVIKVEMDMKTSTPEELESLKHELAGVLHVLEPVRITFSDEPDKYYLGLPVDDVTPDNLTRWFQRSEIEFLIPDGVAHSSTYKRLTDFSNATVSKDKTTFTVTNNGTLPAVPIVKIKHNTENGYIGLVNQSGALEIGNREEIDSRTVQKSEIMFDYVTNRGIVKGLAAGDKNVGIFNVDYQKLKGELAIEENWGRPHLYLKHRGDTNGEGGASLTWTIPNDTQGGKGALNEYFWWRQMYWLGAVNEHGYLKIMISDTDDKFLYGFETIKLWNGLNADFNVIATDGKGGTQVIFTRSFSATHQNHLNPFNEPQGWSDCIRRDDVVDIYWFGSRNQRRVPALKGKKSLKVNISFGTFGDRPQVRHMYLDSFIYRKDFIDTFEDIPNKFRQGSEVVINGELDRVIIDGLDTVADVVDNPIWLTLPPGQSTLEVFTSSWIKKPPTITIEFEERWL